MTDDFGSILEKWERLSPESSTNKILKEKGDMEHRSVSLSVSQLRSMLPQRDLDLHGLTGDSARARLSGFLSSAKHDGLIKVCVVTGKGLHSQGGNSVLKDVVLSFLKSCRYIREVQTPPERYGGSGSLWIILKRN